jgi:hypothetical protein
MNTIDDQLFEREEMESFKNFCRRTENDMRMANRRKVDLQDIKEKADDKDGTSLTQDNEPADRH